MMLQTSSRPRLGSIEPSCDTEPSLDRRRKLDLALESAGVGTWHWDAVNDVVVWDAQAMELFGLASEALAGSYAAALDLLHPDDRERVDVEAQASLREGRPYYLEYRIVKADGSVHWMASRGQVRGGGDGQIHEMWGACWSIDERRHAEIAIERRLAVERVFASISERFVRRDTDFDSRVREALALLADFVHADAGCVSVFLEGQHNTEVSHEWTRDPRLVGRIARVGEIELGWPRPPLDHLEVRSIDDLDRDAAPSPAGVGLHAAIAVPLVDGETLFGLLAFARCESEADWREDEILLLRLGGERIMGEILRSREEHALTALARVGHELIFLVDAPAILARVCQLTAEALPADTAVVLTLGAGQNAYQPVSEFGLAPHLWEAVRQFSFAPERMGPRFASHSPSNVLVVETGTGSGGAERLQARFGFSHCLYVGLECAGRPLGLLAACRRNGRGFHAHEARIARGIAQLASFALANAGLIDELAQANRVKSDFIATMSHELRTPLNIILGYGDLLLESVFGPLNEEQEDTIRRIGRSGRTLQRMIEATLEAARIDAGQETIVQEEVAAAEILRQVEEDTSEAREGSAVELVWRADPALPALRADGVKLRLVLRNLVENAIKFTPRGRVAVEARHGEGGTLFTVADTGIGIAPEAMSVIFESFRQGDGSMTRAYGGVGLGLYIVRRLVELMHGRVEVESEIGRGSTFRVWIPAA